MSEISEIKKRILEFIDFEGVSKYEFCKKVGIGKSNLSGTSLQSEIGGSQISQILNHYKQLSPDWLLLGDGPMLRDSIQNNTNQSTADATALALIKRNEELACTVAHLQEELEYWKKATHTPVRETADVSI